MTNIDALIAELGDIPHETDEKRIRGKSRDFYWYSPILKEKLEHIRADLIVAPRNEAEVVQVLSACFKLGIPVTPRGRGTGNYAQCMPLAGGVVLDTKNMDKVKEIADGRAVVEPGALLGKIEEQTRASARQELRMFPSTREIASIGGFVAGGSGGVGSLHWGMLREPGNLLRLRIATMEETPRLIDLTGEQIATVHHSYGVNGLITEVEIALAPAQSWVEVIATFDSWDGSLKAGWEIAHHQGLFLRELAAIQAPIPHRYFRLHRKFLEGEGDNILCILAAPSAMGPLVDEIERYGGRVAFRSDTAPAEAKRGLPHLHHLTWNHTTLHALKTDPEMTYLQVGTPASDPLSALAAIAERYEGEILGHVEFVRAAGRVYASFLPVYRYSTEDRLKTVVRELEGLGCVCYNPHAYTYEEGNNSGPDAARLAMKREYDPKGLLNPGKMIGWEDPDYVYDSAGGWHYQGMRPAADAAE